MPIQRTHGKKIPLYLQKLSCHLLIALIESDRKDRLIDEAFQRELRERDRIASVDSGNHGKFIAVLPRNLKDGLFAANCGDKMLITFY